VTTDAALDLIFAALLIWTKATGPVLLAALVVGVVVGILQAATQINEAAVGFLAKLIGVGLTVALLGSWSLRTLVDYTERTLGSIAHVIQ
jgi:flagellar biosynthesis protein FliQ